MKLVIRNIALVLAAAPALALAGQSTTGMTRGQVRAQLVQLEQAGYSPARKDNYYPRSIQQAEARVQSSESTRQTDASGYGPTQPTAFDSGSAMQIRAAEHSLYRHR